MNIVKNTISFDCISFFQIDARMQSATELRHVSAMNDVSFDLMRFLFFPSVALSALVFVMITFNI